MGPFPLLDCQNPLKKRRPPRRRESVAYGNLRYFRRKAGGPARLRSASVVQSCSILDGFWICFPILIRVQASPEKQNCSKLQRASQNYVGAVAEQLRWFWGLKRVDLVRCSKTVLWIDCFRWPEGPAETIQYARRNEKAVGNIRLHSNDDWLG